jgi:hypothetical protein
VKYICLGCKKVRHDEKVDEALGDGAILTVCKKCHDENVDDPWPFLEGKPRW